MRIEEKGFSILELMTTIGILAIIGAVGFPAIDNFGEQENYEKDLATVRGQINYVRQLSLEDGNAYAIRIVNNNSNNSADLEVWQAQGLKRYNVEYHKSTTTKCSDFDGTGNKVVLTKGTKLNELTKKLEHMTINKCTSISGDCNKVTETKNFFCFLPDGSSPEDARGEIQASSNAGGKKDYIHTYQSGFFNNGKRM